MINPGPPRERHTAGIAPLGRARAEPKCKQAAFHSSCRRCLEHDLIYRLDRGAIRRGTVGLNGVFNSRTHLTDFSVSRGQDHEERLMEARHTSNIHVLTRLPRINTMQRNRRTPACLNPHLLIIFPPYTKNTV